MDIVYRRLPSNYNISFILMIEDSLIFYNHIYLLQR